MKIVVLGDTHGNYEGLDIPEGDVLIFTGDFSSVGSLYDCLNFNKWLREQPHTHKLFIPGNHEINLEKNESRLALITEGTNLNKKVVNIDGLNFFGFSYTLPFNNWGYEMSEEEQEHYFENTAPDKVDILVTHGPPYGILDVNYEGVHSGSKALLKYVQNINPMFHFFGHIHKQYGINKTVSAKTIFANTALIDRLKIIHKPLIFKI